MVDRITANLPSRDFTATETFYHRLGFTTVYRDAGWMILLRAGLELEFFSHPKIDATDSWFSACIRVDDADALLAEWQQLGIASDTGKVPRLTGFFKAGQAPRMFALVDEDGSLLRVIDNGDA
jgi:hypothetical protein